MNLLKNKNFFLLLSGAAVSKLGTAIQSFAFSLYVLFLTGSATKFSFVLSLQFIPKIILSPISGVMADRFDRKKSIVIYDILSGLLVLSMFFLYMFNGSLQLYQIYICTLGLSVIETFFSPVATCLTPMVVESKDLPKAHSLTGTVNSIISMASPIIGGALYGLYDIKYVLLLNGLSFLLSSFSETFIKVNKTNEISEKQTTFTNDIKEGFKFLKKDKFISSLIFILCSLNLILPIVSIGILVLSTSFFNLSPAEIGVFQSALSIPLLIAPLIGGIILSKLSFNKLLKITLFSVALIMFLAGIWLSLSILSSYKVLNIVFIYLVFALTIMSIIILNMSLSVEFQRIVPINIMGRASATLNALITTSTPIGQIIIGFLFDKVSFSLVFIIVGLFVSFMIFYKFYSKSSKPSDIMV